MSWSKILLNPMTFNLLTNTLPTKGKLVYEYNPFRNYRLSENKYYYKEKYYTKDELESECGITLSEDDSTWIGLTDDNVPELYEKGQLIDFDTDELSFSLDHPVNIVPQYSYDGSVNLILNDGLNPPRLINSRFSATGKNTYEIVDRKGNNDTNIYDLGSLFEIDTSLYKRVINIPTIEFLGVYSGGNLKCGNYHFYFKFCDADGNETDFVGESGLVSLFIGDVGPFSSRTGNKNENTYKQVKFLISNGDTSYNYVTVYYSRCLAEDGDNNQTEYKKIDKKFPISNANLGYVLINGFEDSSDIGADEINLNYNIVDAAETSATCLNMLFLGNVHKPEIPYEALTLLSLRFLPYLKEEIYPLQIDLQYLITSSSKGYYDPLYIYNNVGYWNDEIYRLGIVYILPNGELTPVFNIRGRDLIEAFDEGNKLDDDESNDAQYYNYPSYNPDETDTLINYDDDYYLIPPEDNTNSSATFENAKGVVTLKASEYVDKVYSFDIRTSEENLKTLSKYVKGYFFVRLKRIPKVLAQGVTLGLDNVSHTPTIPTQGGFLEELASSLDESTYVETNDIYDVNYISEGFLDRFLFTLKAKSSSIWKKIGKIAAGLAIVVAGVVGSIVTLGGAAVLEAGLLAGLTGAIGAAGAAACVTVGAAVATAATVAVTASVVAIADEVRLATSRALNSKKLNGRETKIPTGYKRSEINDSRKISDNFRDRVIIKDNTVNTVSAIVCPDFEVNQPYYNQIFTGGEFTVKSSRVQCINGLTGYSSNYFTNDENHFYFPSYYNASTSTSSKVKLISVEDNVKCVGLEENKFRSRAGEAEEAYKYELVGTKFDDEDDKKTNSDIIRGSFGPYIGMINYPKYPALIVDIMTPGYDESKTREYFKIRMDDHSTFYAISDRISIKNATQQYNVYRGDCYICQFTHRVNRNFNDPSAPYNDDIIDEDTWRDNYDPSNSEKYANINSGDVNAVKLGMWITFKIRSSNNLNIRSTDGSYVDETAMSGSPRGYYPYLPMSTDGTYKKPDSAIYNKGFASNLSERWNFEIPDVPYIKNWFGTRIMYSDIHVNDAYKNGYRVFQSNHYRDYTREYGDIVKLVPLESSLLCVFEHGVALIPVNERAVAGEGQGGNVFINTSNVLPDNPKIISDMFGSQWAESVLKVPGKSGNSSSLIYGVDTVAKKIWRTDGNSLECISDFRVQEFLNNNISLGERELTPIIGIRNVKTLYNANKQDVMFTFYDNTYGFEEKVWNLCWNELLLKFITFYSWVPSYMENINNVPFSFDRNTSKWIAKLGTSHAENSFADGITLTNNVVNNYLDSNDYAVDNFNVNIEYVDTAGNTKTILYTIPEDKRACYIGALSLSNRTVPDSSMFYTISYTLLRDSYGNYKNFEVKLIGYLMLPDDAKYAGNNVPIYGLYFRSGGDEYTSVLHNDGNNYLEIFDENSEKIYTYESKYNPDSIISELYYRNIAGNIYADSDINKLSTTIKGVYTYNPYEGNWKDMWCGYVPSAEEMEGKSEEEIHELYLTNLHALYNNPNLDLNCEIGNAASEVDANGNYNGIPRKTPYPCTTLGQIESLISWYSDGTPMVHGIPLAYHWVVQQADPTEGSKKVYTDLPIFKDLTGKRVTLPRDEMINPDKIVTLLNIKAEIKILDTVNVGSLSNEYYNLKASYNSGTNLIDAGLYESVVAIMPEWNMLFLSTDFWKHGQAGIIDITDDIYPTYWYGKQHPFEFEFVVVNDPSIHKIFTNIEIIANKAQPESFHYEVVGETYDFAKDKVNMFFRLEAMKALWQYNGADIVYDRNFLKVQTRQQPKSADLPKRYYARQDTINDIEDYYLHVTYPENYDYRHLSGAEVVYYSNRQEFRIWNHAMAVDLDDLDLDSSRSIIAANCQYLEDKWRVTINPILVCYKNEYERKLANSVLISPYNSTWATRDGSTDKIPSLPIYNSPIPDLVLEKGSIEFPNTSTGEGEDNALYGLYSLDDFNKGTSNLPLDTSNWLNDVGIYKYNFGEAHNRKEVDVRDRFIKIRIRYTGDELAIIDFVKTIYKQSYV